jgi:hypothetical protein
LKITVVCQDCGKTREINKPVLGHMPERCSKCAIKATKKRYPPVGKQERILTVTWQPTRGKGLERCW